MPKSKSIENIGVLLRGKSLEKISLISDNFDVCYIVNNFIKELSIISGYIKGKKIIHFVNSMKSARLSKAHYDLFNIKKIQYGFGKKHISNRPGKLKPLMLLYEAMLGSNVVKDLMDIDMYGISTKIRNSGVFCVHFVSEKYRSKNMWIAGLDFYHSAYLTKKNSSYHLKKSNDIGLVDSFIQIVKKNRDIDYHILTYCTKLPKLGNLHVING